MKLRKAPQKVKKASELTELVAKLKLTYTFIPESKLYEKQIESCEKKYMREVVFTSNDSSMLDWLFEKAGGEFKKGPDKIIYLSLQFSK